MIPTPTPTHPLIRVFATALSLTTAILLLSSCKTLDCGAPDKVVILDTHIHLWDTERPEGAAWPPPSETVLFRPVMPTHNDAIRAANGISASIIVEAAGEDRYSDNQWLLEITRHAPKQFPGVVGNLPIGSDGFAEMLARDAADARFVGIRMRQRPGGDAFFTDAVWRDLALLSERGLTLDVLLANFSLADIDTIAGRLPELKICINHVTGLTVTGTPADPDWKAAVMKAAVHPNVVCKVSGIFERTGKQPAPKDPSVYAPTFEVVYEAFGEDRILYGSNWPVSDRGGRYDEQLSIIKGWFADKGDGVLAKLMGQNAARFYGVNL